MANVPNVRDTGPKGGQGIVRERFLMASQWAKWAMTNAELHAFYASKAEKFMTAYSIAMTNYLRPLKVRAITTTGYTGQKGDTLLVSATDSFKVTGVSVVISAPGGEILEKGECQLAETGAGWVYTATVDNPVPAGSSITATAWNYPGHMAEMTVTLS